MKTPVLKDHVDAAEPIAGRPLGHTDFHRRCGEHSRTADGQKRSRKVVPRVGGLEHASRQRGRFCGRFAISQVGHMSEEPVQVVVQQLGRGFDGVRGRRRRGNSGRPNRPGDGPRFRGAGIVAADLEGIDGGPADQ